MKHILILFPLSLLIFFISCTKLVAIDPPTSSITTEQVFGDSADAASAVLGVYASLGTTSTNLSFGTGNISLICGSSADELINFIPVPGYTQYYLNTLTSKNNFLDIYFWTPAYQVIYQANACVDGLNGSNGLSSELKEQLIGEAKFLRGFCYFYLVNLFGDVPYVTSTDFHQSALQGRTPTSTIYNNIISDLIEAEKHLPEDYSQFNDQRVRVNKYGSMALRARIYLYEGKWDSAVSVSSAIINKTSLYNLKDSLNDVFLANSSEAILQWNVNSTIYPYNITTEAYNNIPGDTMSQPYYYLSPQLLNSFESNDLRRSHWLDSTDYNGTYYKFPFKYKAGPVLIQANATPPEYYMVFRLAEQYLIRSEALAQKNDLSNAMIDLNLIRGRAGLQPVDQTLNQFQVLAALYQERKIELFAEWGHRWLDLKRTKQIDQIMGIVTPQKNGGGSWQSYQQYYPIPNAEIIYNPNLKQTSGY